MATGEAEPSKRDVHAEELLEGQEIVKGPRLLPSIETERDAE